MPKRRPETPSLSEQPAQKRLSRSLSTLAAKASSEALRYQPSGSFLNVFMPSSRHPSRLSTTPTPLPKPKPTRPEPLTPGLTLSNRLLSTHPTSDIASIKELLLFPTSLSILKPSWICRFTINTTPQLGPPLPSHIEELLFQKYVSRGIPLPSDQQEKLPYIHLGSTALAFQLHFYIILPNANICPTRLVGGTGNLPYRDLQLIYDTCIRPALDSAYPKRTGWATWTEAKNESHLKPLKSRRHQQAEALQERLHCEGLGILWDAILKFSRRDDEERVKGLMEGGVLVAFGDVKKHDWPGGWIPSWALFKQAWDEAVDVEFLGGEERVVVEMELGL